MTESEHYSPEFKLETVLDVLRGEKTIEQVCEERVIDESLVLRWKYQLLENASKLFNTSLSESPLEKQVEALKQRLREAETLASMGLFFGEDMHLTSNKLGAARAHAAYIQKHPEDEQRVIRKAEYIERVLLDILELFSQAQDFASTPTIHSVSITELLREIIHKSVRSKDIHIQLDFENADDDVVYGFHRQLGQVFRVVVHNAIEAMDKTGVLRVSITPKLLDGVEFLQVNIADTGKGIPAEAQPFIFEIGEQTKNQRSKSAGFGLAWARLFLRTYGGDIILDSEENRGTSVNVLVPRNFGDAI